MKIKILTSVFALVLLFVSTARGTNFDISARVTAEYTGEHTGGFTNSTGGTTGPLTIDGLNTGQGGAQATGGLTGLFTVLAHACGEPFAGSVVEAIASGSSSVTYDDRFMIQSSTLPAGTPVSVHFQFAAGLNKQNNDNVQLSGTATSNSAQVTFGVDMGNGIIGSGTGVYSYSKSFFGHSESTTGMFADTSATSFTLTGMVGQSYGVTVELGADTTANVDPGDVGDDQVQASLVWGAMPLASGVTLVSPGTSAASPDASSVTKEFAQAEVPPPIIELPEPSSLALCTIAGMSVLLPLTPGRRAS